MTADQEPHLVVAALLRRGDRILLVHRTPTRTWYPDCWDLPGGHVDAGEVPAAALSRELFKELGVTVDVVDNPFAHVRGKDFRMDVYALDTWAGEPAILDPTEHDALAWLNHHELAGLKLADQRLPALLEAALR